MRRLIVDCDPGLDDAVAIALALASPELSVEAIVTVSGNCGIDQVTRNAQGILAALGGKAPVYRGYGKPLEGDVRLGISRWGGTGDLLLSTEKAPAARDGFIALYDHGPVTLAAIGPLTNVAALLGERSQARENIEEIVIMGGAFASATDSPPFEFNLWADPVAARAVFAAGVPLTIAPIDLTRAVLIPPDLVRRLQESSGRSAALLHALLPLVGKPGHPAAIHDACAIAWLLWPDLFESQQGTLSLATDQGQLAFTLRPRGPHRRLTRMDTEGFFGRLADRLSS